MKRLLYFSIIMSVSFKAFGAPEYSQGNSFFDRFNEILDKRIVENEENQKAGRKKIALLAAQERFNSGTEDESAVFVALWEWIVGTNREVKIENNSDIKILVKAETKPRLDSKTKIKQFIVNPKSTKLFHLQRDCLLNIEFSGIDNKCPTKETRRMRARSGTCKSSTFVIEQISTNKFIVNEE